MTYKGRPRKKWNLFIKNCVFILVCLNFSHLQSILHLMQYPYWDSFSTAQNRFWTHWFWCLLVLLPFFASPLPHQQNISLWGCFPSGKQKKDTLVKIWDSWVGRVGHWGHAVLGQKLPNTQHGVGRCTGTSSIMKQAHALKEFSKKFTEAEHSFSQQHQLVTLIRKST